MFVCLVSCVSLTARGGLCATRLSADSDRTTCAMNKSREGYQYEQEQDELTTFANLLLVVNFALGLAAIAANAFVIDTIKSR